MRLEDKQYFETIVVQPDDFDSIISESTRMALADLTSLKTKI
jgi:hypothetical protein